MAYVAVNLDAASVKKLKRLVPRSWNEKNHHMTLHMGPLRDGDPDLGTRVAMRVDAIGEKDGRALAVRVADSTVQSDNKVPHITLAVNNGGKPVESNEITNWVDIIPFVVYGEVQEN